MKIEIEFNLGGMDSVVAEFDFVPRKGDMIHFPEDFIKKRDGKPLEYNCITVMFAIHYPMKDIKTCLMVEVS